MPMRNKRRTGVISPKRYEILRSLLLMIAAAGVAALVTILFHIHFPK